MKFFQVIGFFGILVSIDALWCHDCFFLQNYAGSDPNCYPSVPSLTNSTFCPASRIDETGPIIKIDAGWLRAPQAACMTAFGLHNGNVIIGRHCGVFESSHVDTCNRYYGYSFTFPNGTVITFPANSTTSMISCICSDDNCNVHDLPDVLPTTTTGPTMTTTFATTQTTTTTRPTTTTTTPTTTTRRTTTLPPGLHCYTCYSIEGVAGSLPACEDDGASMPSRNCGDEEDWGRQSIPSVSIFYDPAVAKDDRDGTLQNPKVLCGTGRGTWVNNGSSVVVRGCGLFESRYDNTCSRDYSWRVRYPNGTVLIEFPGNTSSALYTCFCSSNHCNGGSVMEVMVGMVMMCVLLSGFFG